MMQLPSTLEALAKLEAYAAFGRQPSVPDIELRQCVGTLLEKHGGVSRWWRDGLKRDLERAGGK